MSLITPTFASSKKFVSICHVQTLSFVSLVSHEGPQVPQQLQELCH